MGRSVTAQNGVVVVVHRQQSSEGACGAVLECKRCRDGAGRCTLASTPSADLRVIDMGGTVARTRGCAERLSGSNGYASGFADKNYDQGETTLGTDSSER
jgi:hypothetical protein